jgi:large subunit ribosomal protein L22
MDIIAYQKSIKMTPRKLRLVADAIRADHPSKALVNLKFMHKAAALPLYKVMKQAVSNAVNNNKVDEKNLKTKHILIEEGPRYKRFRAGARGRARMIVKRTSHIKIVLENKETKQDNKNKKPVKEK